MIEFVNMIEGSSLKIDINDYAMGEYWHSDEWGFECEPNGRRVQALVSNDNNIIKYCGKTTEQVIDATGKMPYINIDLINCFKVNTLLDGYLFAENYGNIVKILESSSLKNIELQRNKKDRPIFIITDIIYEDGIDCSELPLFDRKKKLQKYKNDITNKFEYLKISDFFLKQKQQTFEDLSKNNDTFIFKLLESPYIFGKSSFWKILKKGKHYLVVIMGFKDGKKGKFQNMCGSLEVGQYKNGKLEKLTNISSGMTIDNRINFFNNKNKYLNKVIEIRALGRTEKSFNEAVFCKLRDDINHQDCIFE